MAALGTSGRLQSPEELDRLRAGSTEAFADVFRQYAPLVHGVAWRLLQSEEAEDVVQEVFLGLPRALPGYRREGPFEAWLKRVAVRTALMRLRSMRRRPEAAGVAVPDLPTGRGPDALIDRIALERALVRLPDSLRVVFVLKVVQGYSHEEIAATLEITHEASRARLARARIELRLLLA